MALERFAERIREIENMSVFVDEFVNGQIVHVNEIENHFTRMEMNNEILYLRVNSTMLKPKIPVVTRANVTVQVSKPYRSSVSDKIHVK